MNTQVRKEWQLSFIGWSGLILFLTSIDKLYDLWVPAEKELNNHPLWALQEWGLWYLLTPILFRLLSQAAEQNRLTPKRYTLICSVIFVNSMAYQAIFDLFVFKDNISYTLLYFAPVHPLAIFVNVYIWRKLLNPVLHNNLQSDLETAQSLTAVAKAQSTPKPGISIEQDNGHIQLAFDHISHINSASNYVEICTTSKTWLKRATLKEVEASLPPEAFIRCHRSHLVNVQQIESIRLKQSGSGVLLLKNGQQIALSKAHKQSVKACLSNRDLQSETNAESIHPQQL